MNRQMGRLIRMACAALAFVLAGPATPAWANYWVTNVSVSHLTATAIANSVTTSTAMDQLDIESDGYDIDQYYYSYWLGWVGSISNYNVSYASGSGNLSFPSGLRVGRIDTHYMAYLSPYTDESTFSTYY